jgi:hypothetical protein
MTFLPFVVANAGVPMLAFHMPAFVLALVPIVAIEALILARRFAVPWIRTLWPTCAANLASTFIGVPVAWGALLALEIVTTGGGGHGFATPWAKFKTIVLQAPWLIPHEAQLYWLIPVANLVLLPFYFFASVFVERWIIRRFYRGVPVQRVDRAVWLANSVSYALLLALSVAWLMMSIRGRWPTT